MITCAACREIRCKYQVCNNLKFDFEMFEKCEAGAGDGRAGPVDLGHHQGSPGTRLARALELAGHLGPQDHRGLREGVRGLGLLKGHSQVINVENQSSPLSLVQVQRGLALIGRKLQRVAFANYLMP